MTDWIYDDEGEPIAYVTDDGERIEIQSAPVERDSSPWWVDSDDPTETGTELDAEYLYENRPEPTISVGYSDKLPVAPQLRHDTDMQEDAERDSKAYGRSGAYTISAPSWSKPDGEAAWGKDKNQDLLELDTGGGKRGYDDSGKVDRKHEDMVLDARRVYADWGLSKFDTEQALSLLRRMSFDTFGRYYGGRIGAYIAAAVVTLFACATDALKSDLIEPMRDFYESSKVVIDGQVVFEGNPSGRFERLIRIAFEKYGHRGVDVPVADAPIAVAG